jgi:hypothetical protein
MRKRVKTITKVTHEYGTVAICRQLLTSLLELAAGGGITKDHIDSWVDKTIKISEDEDGDALTVEEHLVPITADTPAAPAAVEIAKATYKAAY